ncbi:MAG: class I SAM-dependent methyltransferase [Actinomycetota bacterium]
MTMTEQVGTTTVSPTIQEQAPTVLSAVAGHMGHRTIVIGLRCGLIETLAEHPDGLTPGGLADRLGLDEFYTGVWCRGAVAAGVLERDGDHYRLAPHMDTLLLDASSPAYAGALFQLTERPELFERFERVLPTGARLWWDDCSPEWIAAVTGTGTPFNTRLVPSGLSQVPGLSERLEDGCRIVDTACGTGVGLVRLAEQYPRCRVVGIDGDTHSIDIAARRVQEAGIDDRVELEASPLEEMRIDPPATLVINNISMHECRDIDRATANVLAGLEPGGWFVISDFPFPEDDEGLKALPGQLMAGIQFFEAQIDDQLLPRSAYDDLLSRHGFTDLGHAELAPVHALTWGRRPS